MSRRTLAELLQGLADTPGLDRVTVTGLSLDSRAIRPGDAFVALPGGSTHGLRFADTARAAGAAAIVYEPPVPADMVVPADAIGVPGLRAALGGIADRFHGAPSAALTVVGVTGTNGKTSTVQLLAQAFTLAGHVAGSIGTLGAGLHGRIAAGERTTPDVIAVHRLLAELRDAGATHVAMEVSSHALDQGRVDGVRFAVAAFTNLTRDHLDYHGDMASYGAAKARLFQWPGLRAAVVNLDDDFGRRLHAGLPAGLRRVGLSSRGAEAALRAEQVRLTPAGIAFELVQGDERMRIDSPLLGRFNVDNLLAVAGVLLALDWPLAKIAGVLPRLQPVAGRMNRLGGDGVRPLVVVDYAHTPDALEQALSSLRAHARGLLVCVFGCGGERDRGKRPQMAAIAEAHADRVIVTDDNPRGEDGDAIVAEILAGFARRDAVAVERDRGRAIARAVAEAGPDDIVLIAGKGHESYQEVRGVRHPFDDLEVARRALEAVT
ncbi:UDP-N-acetylmuramoyl-L-alanyl-D-glutamate--2,6-diaminopimelate ligase [Rehaibacterium terrae]|jgi:UDP-N-acetylmuramoyl-L-alanyl-D-glutamate--2,6-diaminopimelate ligase|uniref:UDP-N-acetylmuramoyl-L-alanyl-D-glutamate--2,6-diaminopimelate ligase n=1 Tax=Rehaibacterium terrae TaxID=1341696 RepID=A0A7W7V797_9GAMM|nr:UDP-N-acetylmuramoyl-L-alanyl-D-glutamate--2,6-diaminopimelate ligase [Rehaibacterium terrae]MBB5014545.1 UDP-N-acetylmuramoyl-L-alanyl-D-glutamate--2,6-diaminopimelate ligase [Rehaibacterium terrae]